MLEITTTDAPTVGDVLTLLRRIRDEAEKLVERVRADAACFVGQREGIKSIEETRKRLDDVRKHANAVLALIGRLQAGREVVVSYWASRTIDALGLATSDRVAQTEARLEHLARRIEALAAKGEKAA